jgi:hypothetical protein
MKYTKKPWKIDISNDRKGSETICIHAGKGPFDNQWITEAKGSHVGPIDDEERLGNAKLISKAPEMYEALKGIIRLKDVIAYGEPVDMGCVDEARAIDTMFVKLNSLLKEIES